LLREAVDSVLNQTYRNIELVVVNDGSTDGAFDYIADITDSRLRIIHQENTGKSLALNRALREISGEFYAVQDADDISYPERIERQLQRMLDEPDLAAVFCGHDLVLRGKRCAPRFRAKDRDECNENIREYRMPAHDPTAMYRVELVRGFEYDPAFRIGQGYDYILRVGEQYPMTVLGECLYSYRVHDQSITKGDPRQRSQMVRALLKKACERRGECFDTRFPVRNRSRQINRMRDNSLATNFMESVVDLRSVGRWWEALEAGLICAKLHPLDPFYYRALLFAILPDGVRRSLRRSERSQVGAQWAQRAESTTEEESTLESPTAPDKER
jgi:glycosyltransferase involved in cell wall biosynthesis